MGGNPMIRRTLALTVLLCLFLETLFGQEAIAKVLSSAGVTKALNAEQILRVLSRGDDVFLGDMIVVGEAAKIQIKFTDGTLLNLIEKSQFWVNQYQYQKNQNANQFGAELLKGGFRITTGDIEKTNPDQYQVKALNSTLGFMGTTLEAFIDQDRLYARCVCGRAFLKNRLGEKIFGQEESAQFVTTKEDSPPELLKNRPEEFSPTLFIPPMGSMNCSSGFDRFDPFIFENQVK